MPVTGKAAHAGRDEEAAEVRFAFQLPRTALHAIKKAALDRDIAATQLVREWITTGLAGGFDDRRVPQLSRGQPISQFPVALTPQERRALRDRCIEEDMSGAQLVRRWVACGLHCSQQAAPASPAVPDR